MVRNRHKWVAEAVLFCGRQCISLRCDNELINTTQPHHPEEMDNNKEQINRNVEIFWQRY